MLAIEQVFDCMQPLIVAFVVEVQVSASGQFEDFSSINPTVHTAAESVAFAHTIAGFALVFEDFVDCCLPLEKRQ